ncbi:hypothetical protein SAY87_020613 [Trapa incisa]|uniref:J domain-containing protein n=1 Tax=Trapa incisa TaxID=236973 RepID=A0AAN7JQ29_9MYRT|nr:hypothetical protein SAY87_020613 [Trapa incisa]
MAERLLGLAEKFLLSRDLTASRKYALLAQEAEPLLDGSGRILAILDVLHAAERRVNNQHDWYAILQIDRRTNDQELIKRHYRRLALLLHPDKNKYPCADQAFQFVAASWAILSDPGKKSSFDRELGFFTTVDLSSSVAQQVKMTARRSGPSTGAFAEVARAQTESKPPLPPPPPPQKHPEAAVEVNAGGDMSSSSTFWTTCPYCYYLHEYPTMYENCCLRCQECGRAFHGGGW